MALKGIIFLDFNRCKAHAGSIGWTSPSLCADSCPLYKAHLSIFIFLLVNFHRILAFDSCTANMCSLWNCTEKPAQTEEKRLATWGTDVPEDLVLDQKLLAEALKKVNMDHLRLLMKL